jgi:Cys-tRNA(Pro)/Cys-tRNA(Cys) deacylase
MCPPSRRVASGACRRIDDDACVAKKSGAGGTPATVALTRAGVAFTTHAYEHDPAATSYGMEAANLLGLPHEQVFKTLLADVDGALVVGIVPVARKLDLKALAAAVDGKRAAMADPAVAERTTGYVVGGISPLGQRKHLRTVLDDSALAFDTVYVSGGRRGFDLGLSPIDLATQTGAVTAPIARD